VDVLAKKYCRGKDFWRWIELIAALKAKKKSEWIQITQAMPLLIYLRRLTAGTDCRIWERQHPPMKTDKGFCSKRFAHATLKYEIAVDSHRSQIIWINHYGSSRAERGAAMKH
jgi:hypothetical protein